MPSRLKQRKECGRDTRTSARRGSFRTGGGRDGGRDGGRTHRYGSKAPRYPGLGVPQRSLRDLERYSLSLRPGVGPTTGGSRIIHQFTV